MFTSFVQYHLLNVLCCFNVCRLVIWITSLVLSSQLLCCKLWLVLCIILRKKLTIACIGSDVLSVKGKISYADCNLNWR